MTASFDENNPKYWVMFNRVHIRIAARGISIALIVLIGVDLVQSFGRSTTGMLYSWMAACFAFGIYGSLIYAVFKEKRMFIIPFIIFQTVFVTFLSLALFVFTMSALFSPSTIKKFGVELGSINDKAEPYEQTKELRGFIVSFFLLAGLVTAIQMWAFDIIHRFFYFLKDRETSFNFNLETEFQMDG